MTVSAAMYALDDHFVSDQLVADPDMCRTASGNTLHVEVGDESFDFHQSQFATAFFGLCQVLSFHP